MIKGLYYPAKSSAQQEAELSLSADNYQLWIDAELVKQASIDELKISPRMGNIPRQIKFADGSLFSSGDNAAIDSWQNQHRRDSANHLLHQLESHWAAVVLAVVITLASGLGFIRYGVPYFSYQIANALPEKSGVYISRQTFDFLDKHWFEESQIDAKKQRQLSLHFEKKLVPLAQSQHEFKLHFRELKDPDKKGEWASMPNAFALPSGDIIITDGLINLADNLAQIDAILLHEIAHVELNHGLQQLIQSSFFAIAIAFVSGDLNALAELLITAQTLLMQSQYSQGFETEADSYAFEKMPQLDLSPLAFAQIMEKMEAYYQAQAKQGTDEQAELEQLLEVIWQLFASHPDTQQRIDRAKQYAQQLEAD